MFVRRTDESGGGPAANAACLLASWGVPTAFAGCLGDDREGRMILEEFLAAGIETGLLFTAHGYRTPSASVLVNLSKGTRTVLTRQSDPIEYRPDWSVLSRTPSVILTDGHQLKAAYEAHERFPDALFVLDGGSLREETRALLPISDYALCSESFGAALLGRTALNTIETAAEALRAVQAECPGRAALTLGERGLVYDDGGLVRHLPAFPVKAVDTTGAGDVFHGAFVFALFKNRPFPDALRFAQAAAAVSVTRPGGRSSFPKLEEAKKFFSNAPTADPGDAEK